MNPTTMDELRAAIRALSAVPGHAAVLLILNNPPRAGWLGLIRYDANANTVDLHDADMAQTSPGLLPAVIPAMPATVPTRFITCPYQGCRNPDTPIVWVGATPRYGEHNVPGTQEPCSLVGLGVGSHNLSAATLRNAP